MEQGVYVFPVAGIIVIVAGVAFAIQGHRIMKDYEEFKAKSAQTTGVVIELHLKNAVRVGRRNRGRASYWVPEVRFKLPDGRIVEAESMTGITSVSWTGSVYATAAPSIVASS
ncbi:hypothetical protein BH24ACT22_BH24ACT22_07440 [soil metagenome]